MRRSAQTLLPLEVAIIEVLTAEIGGDGLHGYAVAARVAAAEGSRRLTAHGTLYKALARLERRGLVASSWEDPAAAVAAGRPRRRRYRITALGGEALRAHPRVAPRGAFRPGGAGT